jgi:hypothetical protein
MGRNPATGAAIKIAAKKVVKFRVAKSPKDAIVPPKAPKAKKVQSFQNVALCNVCLILERTLHSEFCLELARHQNGSPWVGCDGGRG